MAGKRLIQLCSFRSSRAQCPKGAILACAVFLCVPNCFQLAAQEQPMQRQSNAADPKVTQRVGELIAILGAPEADGKNLEQTSEAIGELVGIGVLAAPHLIKAIIAGNRTAAAYSALAAR
jgi:hypothetical protein